MPAESLDAFQPQGAALSRRYRSIAAPDSCGIEIYDIFLSPVRRWRRDEHAVYRSLSGCMRLPIIHVSELGFPEGPRRAFRSWAGRRHRTPRLNTQARGSATTCETRT